MSAKVDATKAGTIRTRQEYTMEDAKRDAMSTGSTTFSFTTIMDLSVDKPQPKIVNVKNKKNGRRV